jgi:hypothetical protein
VNQPSTGRLDKDTNIHAAYLDSTEKTDYIITAIRFQMTIDILARIEIFHPSK